MNGFIQITVAVMLTGSAAMAMPADQNPVPRDPVGELKHQDWAFSLLIEAYRQVQNSIIESDYQNRLEGISHLPDADARAESRTLAKQERDLRIRKLCVTLGNFGIAYDSARHTDENREGIDVPHEVNTDAAAEELKDFVVITPGRSAPAHTVLRDARPDQCAN